MKIEKMFKKDIMRPINGVIKVGQDDEDSLFQELSEYIITRELRKHFSTFLTNYSNAIDQPTEKTGVWISGFFGSGKSHFLKILSYLLSNKEVRGQKSVDIFEDKFDDPMMYATLVRCAQVPTESILFNIDTVAPINKDKTAILRIFASVFYNHLGYSGNLKVAQLERFIDKQGKTEEFRTAFEEVNGGIWIKERDSYAFFEDDIVEVMKITLNMSETTARNWFNGEENTDMSIKQLVDEIKEYVDSQGKNFRLLFCVDEVGQYIGDDGNLMLNLQSIVEQVGSQCRGQVWVMVTSQEAIDSVVKIVGDDFSKIQGRFDTRLSLSSQSVDEVIKKRLLEKTEDAAKLLEYVYEKEHAVLKNLFTFNNAVLDIKGFSDAGDFSATYPFVPYQFIIIQKVLAEIRKKGNAGKHLSGGERSMLSGFQEAAQWIREKDENALVPFYQFYDTVHTFLESPIRRVIDRCQTAADKNDGLEQQDVDVLKLLYLIRYIEDIKANVDNIAILMIDDIRADKIDIRKRIAESLARLVGQNYVSRNGDSYTFLTDEEQEIASDITKTSVDHALIVQGIAQTIFGDIYPSKKFKYGKYDFAFDQYIDETLIGMAGNAIRLRFVTAASDYCRDNVPKEKLIGDSLQNKEALIVLSGKNQYYEELRQAAQIQKYAKQKNLQQAPESIRNIIRDRQSQARVLEENAKDKIKKAIAEGTFYVYGEMIDLKSGDAKDKIDTAMTQLIAGVYNKLDYVNLFSENDADISRILNSEPMPVGLSGTGANNGDALNEISQWIDMQIGNNFLSLSMGDIQKRFQGTPYGWREVDIAAIMARLIVSQKITIQYGGANIGKDEKRLVDYLRKKTEIDKASVMLRSAPSEDLMRKSATFLRDWLGQMDIPKDEDGLVTFVTKEFESKRQHYNDLLEREYTHDRYPEKEVTIAARDLMDDILSQRKDSIALLGRLVNKQDDLRNKTEDMEAVETFFNSKSQQKAIFDAARSLEKSLQNERDYFAADAETNKKIGEITTILALSKPYGRIKDLPELSQDVRRAYDVLLGQKKEEVYKQITQCMEDVRAFAGAGSPAEEEIGKADKRFSEYRQRAVEVTSLTGLDAMKTQLSNYTNTVCMQLASIIREPPVSRDEDTPGKEPPKSKKIAPVSRHAVFPMKWLRNREDVDTYLEEAKKKLYDALEDNDEIQIS